MATTDSNGSWVAMTPTQRDTAVDDNRTQHIRLSFAIHRLESCLGHAAPGRLQQWAANVSDALEVLLSAMFESRECVCLDDGLVEEIKITTPRLLNRIERLRTEFDGLVQQAKAIQRELSNPKETMDIYFSDIRQRLSWLLTAVKHHQAKEVDLVYEAIQVDIGVGD